MAESAIKHIRQPALTRILRSCMILLSGDKFGIIWRVVLGHFWQAK
jgi:hypothetical protein